MERERMFSFAIVQLNHKFTNKIISKQQNSESRAEALEMEQVRLELEGPGLTVCAIISATIFKAL